MIYSIAVKEGCCNLLKWSTQHCELVKILTIALAGHVIRAVNIAIVSALVEEGLFVKVA